MNVEKEKGPDVPLAIEFTLKTSGARAHQLKKSLPEERRNFKRVLESQNMRFALFAALRSVEEPS